MNKNEGLEAGKNEDLNCQIPTLNVLFEIWSNDLGYVDIKMVFMHNYDCYMYVAYG